jgi:transposase
VLEARPGAAVFVLKVEETPDLWSDESALARTPVTFYDHAEPKHWRHLNFFNKKCVMVCVHCCGCRGNDGTVFCVTPP